MVLIRYGNEKTKKMIGKEKMVYTEDTVWSMPRDAGLRADQLDAAGYFTIVEEKRFSNAPSEHVVWRSESHRRGTKNYKKTERKSVKKDEGQIRLKKETAKKRRSEGV